MRHEKREIRGATEAEVNERPKAGGNPQVHSRHVGGGVTRMHPCLKAQGMECAIVKQHDDQQKQLVEKEKEEEVAKNISRRGHQER